MVEKLVAGKHFPVSGVRKFDGKIYQLQSVHRTKSSARKEKEKWKKKGKLVRIWKGSGGFPFHVWIR